MTGYGKCEKQTENLSLNLELRTLNSRYLDFSHRLPKILLPFEDEASKLIKDKCVRGKIILSVRFECFNNSETNLTLNKDKLNEYLKLIDEIKENISISEELSIKDVLSFPEIIVNENCDDEIELKNIFLDSLKYALEENDKSRILEGNNLKKDLIDRLKIIIDVINEISLVFKKNYKQNFEKYKKKIKDLFDDLEIEENRIYQEIAISAEKKDITEEIVRFNSHVSLFKEFMNSKNNEGKKLNFLLQEMGREVNTIVSKTDVIEISHMVVKLKDEIEKIREQVQNII